MAQLVRFWWADAHDVFLARRRLAKALSTQCEGWSVVRWDETFFEKKEEAWPALLHEIEIPSIFSQGKIILTYGIPSCHSLLADELKNIPDGIMLAMVANPDRTLRLMHKAKDLGPLGRIDEPLILTTSNVVGWIQQRAKDLGVKIDEMACRMLVERMGLDANMLTSEMAKLLLLVDDGIISPAAVQQVAYGQGDSDFFTMMNHALAGDMLAAHEQLRRLISVSGSEGVAGLWMDWARRMAIAEGIGRDHNAAGGMLAAKKRDKGFDKKDVLKIAEFDEGITPRKAPIAMFKDTKGIYRSCQDIAGKPDGWGYYALSWLHQALLGIRQGQEGTRVLEGLLEAMARK